MYTPTRSNVYRFNLESGERVYYNRISGYGVERDGQYLTVPTGAELIEIAQIVSDDDAAFAEEIAMEHVAQTSKW